MKGKEEIIGAYEFIDGDEDDNRKLKLQFIDEFNAAIQSDVSGEFKKASNAFESLWPPILMMR